MKKITALVGLFLLLAACDTMDPALGDGTPVQSEVDDADARITLAYWHFPADWRTTEGVSTGSYLADLPLSSTGVMTWEFGGVADHAGTTMNDIEGVGATRDVTVSGTGRIGQSMYLAVSTEGHEEIRVSYATRRSGSGYNLQTICYSLDGGNTFEETCWEHIPATDAWGLTEVDLSGIPGVKNNPYIVIRITVDTVERDGATPTGAGNNRFDNILVSGVEMVSPAPEPLAPGPGSLEGFFSPVNLASDVYNRVRGGRTVPLKFRVYDADGIEVTDPAGVDFRVYGMDSCQEGSEVNEVTDEQILRGTGTIRYADDQFIANWSTPRVRASTCFVVEVHAEHAMTSALFEVH
jgi:hypothetical protein